MIRAIAPCCFFLAALPGCSAVEWQHRHPSVSGNMKIALLNETNTKHNGIVSTVDGFCASEKQCPETMVQPVMKQYSTGEALGKLFYTVTPYGMMTMPFADFDGRKIAVPPGRIGIVIKHTKTDELSREVILNMSEGPTSTVISWNCSNGGEKNIVANSSLGKEVSSSKMLLTYKDLMVVNFFQDEVHNTKNIYLSKRNVYEWQRVLWVDLAADKKYTVDLAKNKITDDVGTIVADTNHSEDKVPDALKPVPEQWILSEPQKSPWIYKNAKFVVDDNCMISILDEQDRIIFGTKLATQ